MRSDYNNLGGRGNEPKEAIPEGIGLVMLNNSAVLIGVVFLSVEKLYEFYCWKYKRSIVKILNIRIRFWFNPANKSSVRNI